MSVMTANLKLFKQNRSILMFFGFIVLSIFFPMFNGYKHRLPGVTNLLYTISFGPVFLAGFAVSSLYQEIWTRPFSFTLPGLFRMHRKILFVIGLVFSIFYALPFLLYPDTTASVSLLYFGASFLMSMTIYFMAVWVTSQDKYLLTGLAIQAPIIGNATLGFPLYLDRAVINYPYANLIVGSIVVIFSWKILGRSALARKNFGQVFVGLGDGFNMRKTWNRQKKQKLMKQKKGQSGLVEIFENLCHGRMKSHNHFSIGRCIWGAIYEGLVKFLGNSSIWLFFYFLFMVVIIGYLWGSVPRGKAMFEGAIFYVLCIGTIKVILPIRSDLLLTVGRRERFWREPWQPL